RSCGGAASRLPPPWGGGAAAAFLPPRKSANASGLYSCLIAGASYLLLARRPGSVRSGAVPEAVGKGLQREQFRQESRPLDRHRPASRRTFQPVSDVLEPRAAIDSGVFGLRGRRQSRPG